MDEMNFEELFFEGIRDVEYKEFAELCGNTNEAQLSGNHGVNCTTKASVPLEAHHARSAVGFEDVSLLLKDEQQMLAQVPDISSAVKELQLDTKENITELNTMRRYIERLEQWCGHIHNLLQSLEARITYTVQPGPMGSRAERDSDHVQKDDKEKDK